jgi:hypothetical protein
MGSTESLRPLDTEVLPKLEVVGNQDVIESLKRREPGTVIIIPSGGANGVNGAGQLLELSRQGLLKDTTGVPVPLVTLSAGTMVASLFAGKMLEQAPQLFNQASKGFDWKKFPKLITEKDLRSIRDEHLPDLISQLSACENPIYTVLTRADTLDSCLVDLRNGKVFLEVNSDEQARIRKQLENPDIPIGRAMDLAKRLKQLQDEQYEGRQDKLRNPDLSIGEAMAAAQLPLMGDGQYELLNERANIEEVLLASIWPAPLTGEAGRRIFVEGGLRDVLFTDGAFGRAGYVPVAPTIAVMEKTGYDLRQIAVLNNYTFGKWPFFPRFSYPFINALSHLLITDSDSDRGALVRMVEATYAEYNEWLWYLSAGVSRSTSGKEIKIASLYPPTNVTSGIIVGATQEGLESAFESSSKAMKSLLET